MRRLLPVLLALLLLGAAASAQDTRRNSQILKTSISARADNHLINFNFAKLFDRLNIFGQMRQ